MEWVAVIAVIVSALQFFIYGKQKKKLKGEILKKEIEKQDLKDEENVRTQEEKRKIYEELKTNFFKGDPGDSDHTSGNC